MCFSSQVFITYIYINVATIWLNNNGIITENYMYNKRVSVSRDTNVNRGARQNYKHADGET